MNKGKKVTLGLFAILGFVILGWGITSEKKPICLKQPLEIHIAKSGAVQGIWYPTGKIDFRLWPQHNQGILLTSQDLSWNSYRFCRILAKPGTRWKNRPAVVVTSDGQKIALTQYLNEGHWKIFN